MQVKQDTNADDDYDYIENDAPPAQQPQTQTPIYKNSDDIENDPIGFMGLLMILMILRRTFALVYRHAYQLHAAALTVLLPTLFVAMFALLLGDTLFQTYAANDATDLPYSLQEHGANHHDASFTMNNGDDILIMNNATQSPTMDNANVTLLLAPTSFMAGPTTNINVDKQKAFFF